MTDRIAVGVIRKAHGVRGEASVEAWTDSPERFAELKDVTLVSPDDETKTRTATIAASRAHGDRALVKFAGIDSPEEIRPLHNWTIEIPADQARKLETDEYYLHDLVGLRLIDEDGSDRGVVTEAYEGGSGVLLNVKRPDGNEFEVPFAADICTKVDLDAKTIAVALPDGLDDLDHVED